MLLLALLLLPIPARAQDGGVIDQAFETAPAEPPAYGEYWQVGTGLNLGLVDVVFRSGHVWVEASTVAGMPIATYQNPVFGGVVAVGYTLDLGFNGVGRWYFELFLEAVVGRVQQGGASGYMGGGGWGFGFRYSLPSGWSLQFRMPCLGMVVEDYNATHTFSAGESVLDFFAANAFGWSFFTFGRRF